MAKLRIPGLTPKKTASGLRYYWQPSPSQRKAGWTPLALGGDAEAAIRAAMKRNDEVESWKIGGARPRAIGPLIQRGTVGALIAKFEAERLPALRASTQHEYRSCLKRIRIWTNDGQAPLNVVTRKRVQTLKQALLQPAVYAEDGRSYYVTAKAASLLSKPVGGTEVADLPVKQQVYATGKSNAAFVEVTFETGQGSITGWLARADLYVKLHRAASILRVLRTLMQYGCDNDMIGENPVSRAHIPEPPPRGSIVSGRAVAAIMDASLQLDPPRPSVALGIVIGLNTMQRQADILHLGTLNWREMTDIPPEARPVLAGADGRVMGFRLKQQKGNKWIEVPVAGPARASIEAAIAAAQGEQRKVTALIVDEDEDRAYPQWKFQRQFRAAVDLARETAAKAGDAELVEELADVEFRDLRRTGMCLYAELGVPVEMIAAISGHDIDRTRKILKTYMPRNSRMAAAAVAMAMQRLEARGAAEQAREGQG